jgi:hypothetical protein
MSSDEFGRSSSAKVPSAPPSSLVPATPPSSSGRPPADYVAWGPVRDAITAIHNLETLLKSPRVGTKVLAEVLHEFLNGVTVLREAFAKAAHSAKGEPSLAARGALAEFTRARLDELERSMRQGMTTDFDARGRLGLEQVVIRVSVDLDAAAELLDLSERSEHVVETELSLEELARVSIRPARVGDREIALRLVKHEGDCVLRADPHVFKRLVAFAVARVHAQGALEPTIRVHGDEECACIEVGPMRPGEASIPVTRTRLVRRIDPTDAIVEAAAESAGIDVKASGAVITLSVPRLRG